MSHSATEQEPVTGVDFGSALAEARKAKNYTIADIRENLKIPVAVIEAIERNDVDALPTATYTQGYIRTYARFLEIDEEAQLAAFNRAVPHELVSELKPRSSLPDEASSQSPLVKSVTLLLLLLGLFALAYVAFQYYQEKAEDIEQSQQMALEPATGSSVDAPGDMMNQSGAMDEDDLEGEDFSLNPVPAEALEETYGLALDEAPDETSPEALTDELPAETATDTLEIVAPKGAWLEVYDDTNARLFYNMVKKGETEILTGTAPFRIKVGNADVSRVILNDVEVDMSDYTRRNNTAVFTISGKDGDVVFH